MEIKEAIAILARIQEPEAWEPQITREAWQALEMAKEALVKESQSLAKDSVKDLPDTKVGNFSEIPNSSDTIYRQAAIDALHMHLMYRMGTDSNKKRLDEWINNLPSAQTERLTDDDFETIRIHLNACKEKLCNQRRWKEAEEYQHIIDRFMAFASAQPEIIRCKDCKYWKDSDGVYRRGFDAESKCPLNLKEVYEGTFYCGMAERRTDG